LAIICYPYLTKAEFKENEINDGEINENLFKFATNSASSEFKLDTDGNESSDSKFTDLFDLKESGTCIKRPIILIFDSFFDCVPKQKIIKNLTE